MKKTLVKSEDAAAFIANFHGMLHACKGLLETAARDGAINGNIQFWLVPKRTEEFPKKK